MSGDLEVTWAVAHEVPGTEQKPPASARLPSADGLAEHESRRTLLPFAGDADTCSVSGGGLRTRPSPASGVGNPRLRPERALLMVTVSSVLRARCPLPFGVPLSLCLGEVPRDWVWGNALGPKGRGLFPAL